MLRNGINYLAEIDSAIEKRINMPDYRWVWYHNHRAFVGSDLLDQRIFVSTHLDTYDNRTVLLGYVRYAINNTTGIADSIAMACFEPAYSAVFAKDMLESLDVIFMDNGVHKIEWTTCAENDHAHRQYMKLIDMFGGKYVGRWTETIMLHGKHYDLHLYELLRRDYVEHRPRRFTNRKPSIL